MAFVTIPGLLFAKAVTKGLSKNPVEKAKGFFAKALNHISELRKRYQAERIKEQEKVQQFYEGLQKGLDIAEDMFFCNNFKKDEENDNA